MSSGRTALLRRLADLPRPWRLALYALATGVLLYLCLAPTEKVPGAGLFWDKWEHVVAWFVLTGLGFLLAPKRPRAIVGYALAFGAGIELLQRLIGFGRHGDLLDLFADSLGVLAAAVVALAVRAARRR